MKRVLSTIMALLLVAPTFGVYAQDDERGPILIMQSPDQDDKVDHADKITVEFKDEVMAFDVDPIIEDGRTLVPFRGIFEIMGCVVDYFADEDGKKTVSARRGNDTLMLNIGEPEMYFNGEKITLDVPGKIKDNRTLVPIRAISEAFECEVFWEEDTKTVSIYPPAGHFSIKPQQLSEIVTDENGNVLIEAVISYPVIDNSMEIPFIDEINEDYKWEAEKFIASAVEKTEEAKLLLEQMGEDEFVPFTFESTYEEIYNIYGILSIKDYKYTNMNSVHPTIVTEVKNFNPGMGEELSLSQILDEEALGTTLRELIYELFSVKLKELGIEPDADGIYNILETEMGSVQYYLKNKSVVIYFNQGQIAPYAVGEISVTIPYDAETFFVDMHSEELEEYVYEYENDRGYEWIVVDYSKDKLSLTEEYEEYSEEELESEYYPVGKKTIRVKGIAKGNALVKLAYVKKGADISAAEAALISTIYVDENNSITVVTESDDVSLLK